MQGLWRTPKTIEPPNSCLTREVEEKHQNPSNPLLSDLHPKRSGEQTVLVKQSSLSSSAPRPRRTLWVTRTADKHKAAALAAAAYALHGDNCYTAVPTEGCATCDTAKSGTCAHGGEITHTASTGKTAASNLSLSARSPHIPCRPRLPTHTSHMYTSTAATILAPTLAPVLSDLPRIASQLYDDHLAHTLPPLVSPFSPASMPPLSPLTPAAHVPAAYTPTAYAHTAHAPSRADELVQDGVVVIAGLPVPNSCSCSDIDALMHDEDREDVITQSTSPFKASASQYATASPLPSNPLPGDVLTRATIDGKVTNRRRRRGVLCGRGEEATELEIWAAKAIPVADMSGLMSPGQSSRVSERAQSQSRDGPVHLGNNVILNGAQHIRTIANERGSTTMLGDAQRTDSTAHNTTQLHANKSTAALFSPGKQQLRPRRRTRWCGRPTRDDASLECYGDVPSSARKEDVRSDLPLAGQHSSDEDASSSDSDVDWYGRCSSIDPATDSDDELEWYGKTIFHDEHTEQEHKAGPPLRGVEHAGVKQDPNCDPCRRNTRDFNADGAASTQRETYNHAPNCRTRAQLDHTCASDSHGPRVARPSPQPVALRPLRVLWVDIGQPPAPAEHRDLGCGGGKGAASSISARSQSTADGTVLSRENHAACRIDRVSTGADSSDCIHAPAKAAAPSAPLRIAPPCPVLPDATVILQLIAEYATCHTFEDVDFLSGRLVQDSHGAADDMTDSVEPAASAAVSQRGEVSAAPVAVSGQHTSSTCRFSPVIAHPCRLTLPDSDSARLPVEGTLCEANEAAFARLRPCDDRCECHCHCRFCSN